MIRKIKKEEIPIIAKKYASIMKKNFTKIGEEPITKEKYEIILKENYKKSLMFVLDNKGIKAFLWFIQEGGEINLEEVFSIERGKGYGSRLMNFLIDHAKKEKVKRINLDVHFKNKDALNFFRKIGFTERTIELSLDL